MRALVKEGRKNPVIRELALSLIERHDQKDWQNEIRSLHAFVRDRIRYTRDIRGVETLQTPWATLDIRQGDCDDKSILLASLLESVGHPTRIVAVGFVPGTCSHVLVETRIGNKWIAAETTEPVQLGWYPRNVKTRFVAHVR